MDGPRIAALPQQCPLCGLDVMRGQRNAPYWTGEGKAAYPAVAHLECIERKARATPGKVLARG